MADISNVKEEEIKDLWLSLEGLSCKTKMHSTCAPGKSDLDIARIRTRVLY